MSVDFQRRDQLASVVRSLPVPDLLAVDRTGVDLRRVWSGTHRVRAGLEGAAARRWRALPHRRCLGCGQELGDVVPARLRRLGDPRGRGPACPGSTPRAWNWPTARNIFARYAVSGKDALDVLDGLVAEMEARKREFAGRVRTIPISTQYPLELLEFDEIGALTKYTDRKTRDAIVERVALLTTQGRALGMSVRGYVQEPTKDTVPVRELFTRRVCLRVTSKTHVGMVLGDGAYERGAWANRIGESEAGHRLRVGRRHCANPCGSARAGCPTTTSRRWSTTSPTAAVVDLSAPRREGVAA